MILRVTLGFGAALAAYLGLAGQMSATELEAGVATALLVAGFAAVQHAREDRKVALSWAAGWRFARAAAGLPGDTVRVGLVLARAIVRPQAGAAEWQTLDTADPGMRAAAVLGTSLSPNGIVVGVEADLMLVHQLALP